MNIFGCWSHVHIINNPSADITALIASAAVLITNYEL